MRFVSKQIEVATSLVRRGSTEVSVEPREGDKVTHRPRDEAMAV